MTQPIANNLYGIANGVSSTSIFLTILATRPPTVNDVNYKVQQRWVDTSLGKEYILTGFTSTGGVTQASWVNLTNGTLSAVDTLSGNTGTNPVTPDGSGNINVRGDSTSINISGDGSHTLTANVVLPATDYSVLVGRTTSIDGITPGLSGLVLTSNGTTSLPTWQAIPSAGITWQEKTSNFSALADYGYFINGATITATLPTSPSEGSTINFIINSTTTFVIQAASGDYIKIGTASSSSGGTCSSTAISTGSSLTLIYMQSTTTWWSLNAPQNVWSVA